MGFYCDLCQDDAEAVEARLDAEISKLRTALLAIIGEVNGCGPKCSDEFKRIGLDSVRGIATRALGETGDSQ